MPTEKMDVDTFLAWVETQTGGRFELCGGYLVAMAPERAIHARDEAGNVATHILAGGAVRFDPPGLEFDLGEVLDGID